nr:glycoside hydrolase family 3 N-terminal domain-containing protein [uncultured Trichococcus sp.]
MTRSAEGDITWIKFDDGTVVSYNANESIIEASGLVFRDLNGNGKLEAFKDWRNSSEERAKDLSSKLPIEYIAGLMLHSHHQTVLEGETKYEKLFGKNTYNGRSFRTGVNQAYEITDQQRELVINNKVRHILLSSVKSSTDAAKWCNSMQELAAKQEWGLPICVSSDPRHTLKGDAEYNLGSGSDVSKWPDNIGIATGRSEEVAFNFGKIMSEEFRAMGISVFLGPQIDIATDPRWSRIAGTFGESAELSSCLTKAFIDGCQSTFTDNGEDVGWGLKSVATIVKHWPGGGTGEGGRDAHYNYGKYAVYPGNNFDEHLKPFLKGAFKLNGKTKTASGVMPYYTISYGQDPSNSNVGNSFSRYIVKYLLREKYKFDGLVCSDWMITADEGPEVETFSGKCWGVEKESVAERHLKILLAGVDQFGGNNDINPVLEAFEKGYELVGTDEMTMLIRSCGYRILLNMFRLGLFDSPYVKVKDAEKIIGNKEFKKLGKDAQERALVIVKNENTVLPIRHRQKVYIPKIHMESSVDWFGNVVPGGKITAVDNTIVDNYFEPVEDSAEADFSIVFVDSPRSSGYDPQKGYIPISLQYGEYTAMTSRQISIAGGDPLEDSSNRSYLDKKSYTQNYYELDAILATKKMMANKPVIVVMNMKKPTIISEFEKNVEGIVCNFGASKEVVLELINGLFSPSGKLPYQLPKDMDTVETQNEDVALDLECYETSEGDILDFGFGLTFLSKQIEDAVDKQFC